MDIEGFKAAVQKIWAVLSVKAALVFKNLKKIPCVFMAVVKNRKSRTDSPKAGPSKNSVTAGIKKCISSVFYHLPKNARAFLDKFRRISADKVLWIWALVMIAGLFLFKLVSGNLPGMDTTLVFSQWWEDHLETQTLVNLAAEFEKQNPGITIKLEKKSWPEIQAMLEAGEEEKKKLDIPDIFSIDPYWIDTMEQKSLLLPVKNSEGVISPALPVISFINPLYYNIALLQEAGFDRPPKSQTEFLSYVQRITQPDKGIYGAGLALGGGDPQSVSRHLLPWIWASAGNPENTEKFTFNSKQVITALNFLNQLKQNLYPSPFNVSEAELTKAFGEGKVGMMIGSITGVKALHTMRGNFGITTIPGPESYTKKPVFPLSFWYAGVYSQTSHPETAQQFLAFLKEKAGIIASGAYAIPGSGRRSPEQSKNDAYYAKAFDMYEAGEMVREIYGSPKVTALNAVIRREIESMFTGAKTPEQCAEAIEQDWEALVSAGDSPGFH